MSFNGTYGYVHHQSNLTIFHIIEIAQNEYFPAFIRKFPYSLIDFSSQLHVFHVLFSISKRREIARHTHFVDIFNGCSIDFLIALQVIQSSRINRLIPQIRNL